MAYRNGTYIAFHADHPENQTETDIKYYRLLSAWNVRDEGDFKFVDSHEKNSIRQGSQREVIERKLIERINNSKNMILIIGETTKNDPDWIPYEISYAVDTCKIPVIAAYTMHAGRVLNPSALATWWPPALKSRIEAQTASIIHVPFKKEPLADAVQQFNHNNLPPGSLMYYSEDTYRLWGI